MSGLFGSTTIKGTRITDFAQSSAEVGVVIPFGYGRFPVTGNVIFAPLPPKEHRKVQKQGKGGVKQETFTYTLSYAVSFCQGPIYGYWWIKRNGKVVWTQDPSAPIEDAAYAAKWAQKATMYFGTATQLPDSTIESYKGSGQVSAFRYLAYIVVEDDDVTDQGGAVPSYEACVIATPPEAYLTSKMYPPLGSEGLRPGVTFNPATQRELVQTTMGDENFFTGFGFGEALIRAPLVTLQPLDDSVSTSFTFGEGTIRAPLKTVLTTPEELTWSVDFGPGLIRVALVTHDTQPPEKITTTFTFGTGLLYVP